MLFAKLDDSPMFRRQLTALEENADVLKDRCTKFHRSCRKYTDGLEESQNGELAFIQALEMFGGANNDSLGESVGGPVIHNFSNALRDIASFKEVLRSQVDHMLTERLLAVVSYDLQGVKEVRKRFDKASAQYDQIRDKVLSLKKDTRPDVAADMEEDRRAAQAQFEQSRFNLVTAVCNIEAKKKFEFLEAVSAFMDAHLRYYKQSYEVLKAMEPYIHQVLTFAQHARERANHEQAALAERMHEYRRQMEEENARALGEEGSLSIMTSLSGPYQMGAGAVEAQKMVEQVMQSTPRGKVQTIKEGYLLKRSSNLRGDWKRRYFVLDSRGVLYYHRKQLTSRPSGVGGVLQSSVQGIQISVQGLLHSKSPDPLSSLFTRMLSRDHSSREPSGSFHLPSTPSVDSATSTPSQSPPHNGGSALMAAGREKEEESSLGQTSINLLTATVKMDAEQGDLRFCFRLVTPAKTYTLQAENAVERTDWMDKINGVIASLLNQQLSDPRSPRAAGQGALTRKDGGEAGLFGEDLSGGDGGRAKGSSRSLQPIERPLELLRLVEGNDACVDCGTSDPDWASLNLGILMCIECSGVHRNLGVHISKVRSTTLDVKVWEPGVVVYLTAMGNKAANAVWEEALPWAELDDRGSFRAPSSLSDRFRPDAESSSLDGSHGQTVKPGPRASLAAKERFIHAKYLDRRFVVQQRMEGEMALDVKKQLWKAVDRGDKQAATSLMIKHSLSPNFTYTEAFGPTESGVPRLGSVRRKGGELSSASSLASSALSIYVPSRQSSLNPRVGGTKDGDEVERLPGNRPGMDPSLEAEQRDLGGCTLLHLACQRGDIGTVEMLLQYGASLADVDSLGRTALHHSILGGDSLCSKMLLQRGLSASVKDYVGRTALELAMDLGGVPDEELFVMLANALSLEHFNPPAPRN